MTRAPWQLTMFVVIMLPVVVSLGFWQLSRAEEKQNLEMEFLAQQGSPALPLTDVAVAPFSPVRIEGQYQQARFLVDNQIHEGRVGYWLLQVFQVLDGRRILVNRGWLPAPPDRADLPEHDWPTGTLQLTGLVWPQMGLPPLLKDEQWQPRWPLRVQRRDIVAMAALTEAEALELRLPAGQPGSLVPAIATPKFGRETHLGYAVQWFGLGLVLVIGWIVVYRRGATRSDT